MIDKTIEKHEVYKHPPHSKPDEMFGVWYSAPAYDIQIQTSAWCVDDEDNPVLFDQLEEAQDWINSFCCDAVEKSNYSPVEYDVDFCAILHNKCRSHPLWGSDQCEDCQGVKGKHCGKLYKK